MFVPPKPKLGVFATYIEDRQPQFKVHTDRGKARSAVMYNIHRGARGGVIYQLVDGDWKIYAVVPPGTKDFLSCLK
jgi:hypothetical protein